MPWLWINDMQIAVKEDKHVLSFMHFTLVPRHRAVGTQFMHPTCKKDEALFGFVPGQPYLHVENDNTKGFKLVKWVTMSVRINNNIMFCMWMLRKT